MSPILSSSAPLTLDYLSHFDYRCVNGRLSGFDWIAPSWVDKTDARRLQSYVLLEAYTSNTSRVFKERVEGESEAQYQAAVQGHREYGDAHSFIRAVLASVLGEDQTIAVDDAANYDAADDSPEQEAYRKAALKQEQLAEWADNADFVNKLVLAEQSATKFGSGVYGLGWDTERNDVVLQVHDPGTYFPVLDDLRPDRYPNKVHIAWQLTPSAAAARGFSDKDVIHRITYELRKLDELRKYNWNDKVTANACFMSEADFVIDRQTRSLNDLVEAFYTLDDEGNEIRDKDLNIDYIPVIHIANTPAGDEHFGQSSLAPIVQILDDLAATDSDKAAATRLTGFPMLVLGGDRVPDKVVVSPGQSINVGEHGHADTISGADGLVGLQQAIDALRDRLSENSQMPKAQLGRINASDVPSGVALSLSFSPLRSLVTLMRLARRPKYRLLFKMVQRFWLANGLTDQVHNAHLEFGAYLPQDTAGVVKDVVALLAAKAISLEVALKMLAEVGIPIESMSQTMADIQSRDFDGADKLLSALGSEAEVANYLGRDIPQVRPTPPQDQYPSQSGKSGPQSDVQA